MLEGLPAIHSLSLPRLRAIARKEIIQLRRDRRSLYMAFIMPAVLVLIFGFAITWDLNDIPFAVYDGDGTQQSRALIEAFQSSGYFTLQERLARLNDADRLLERGTARLVVSIPPGFAADLEAGRPAPVAALLDGGDANTAGIALSYAQGIVAAYSSRALLRGTRVNPPVSAEVRVWYNEDLDSRLMIVPGLVAVIMMTIGAMLTSLTIAREWERGSMEQLASTPVHRLEVVLGKLLPYLGIGLIDMAVVVILGIVVFHVPLRGSLTTLVGASTMFLLGSLGLGIFISAAARSQLLATQVSMLTTYLPGFLLSGFAFDIGNMPAVLQGLSLLVPARYFIVVVRGVFLKGIGPSILWPQGLALALYAVVGVGLAVRSFRKELEEP